jgi:hypothetical protein
MPCCAFIPEVLNEFEIPPPASLFYIAPLPGENPGGGATNARSEVQKVNGRQMIGLGMAM